MTSRERNLVVILPVAAVFGALVLWEMAVRLLEIPRYLLPAPSAVAGEYLTKPQIYWPHFLVTLGEVLFGYACAVVVGSIFAVGIAMSRLAGKAIYPFLVAAEATPKSAIAPLFLVWFGFGLTPKILVVFLIAFFPVVVSTVAGLTSIEEEKLYLARVTGFSRVGSFFRIRLPHALPSVFAGLKLAMTLSVVGAVVAEFVGASSGLGYLIIVAGSTLDTPRLFAALLLLTAMGIGLFFAVDFVEGRAIPWHVSRRRRSR